MRHGQVFPFLCIHIIVAVRIHCRDHIRCRIGTDLLFHCLYDADSFFGAKRRIDKVNDTRAVLIPLVRELAHAYSLADRLEDACLQAEQPEEYLRISEKYQGFLRENREHLPRVGAYMVHSLSGETGSRIYVVDCCFRERSIYSLHNDLIALTQNKAELLEQFTVRKVPLLDVFFVVRDDCVMQPEQVFYDLYEVLRTGVYFPESKYTRREKFDLTIVGFGKSPNSSLPLLLSQSLLRKKSAAVCILKV